MVEKTWWNSTSETMMVEQSWWNSHSLTVMVGTVIEHHVGTVMLEQS